MRVSSTLFCAGNFAQGSPQPQVLYQYSLMRRVPAFTVRFVLQCGRVFVVIARVCALR